LSSGEFVNEAWRPQLAYEVYDRRKLEDRARFLIGNRARIERDRWPAEPELNARTALFEELTAKGHLSRIEFDDDINSVNHRTLQRLLNGWSDSLPSWEQDRRLNEIVEELLIHEVAADIEYGILSPDSLVLTISNFPDGVDEHEATAMGYGVINRKGMVRTTSFEGGRRVVEQVSRSMSDDDTTNYFFAANNLGGAYGSTKVLGNQVLIRRDQFPDGVVDIQRALDSFAGPNVIYGEDKSQPDLNVPEYEDLRQISHEREQQIENFINKLASYERTLNLKYEAGLMSYEEKLNRINARRKELVNEICVLAPEYAKDARGEAAVIHFEKAALAMASGDDYAGSGHLQNAMAVADSRAGAVCGGTGQTAQNENASRETADRLYKEAKLERKDWKWRRGTCLVKECPTRPARTEVGPCSVCRDCQKIFDNGDSPKKVYKVLGFMDMLFESVAEFNRNYDIEQAEKRAKQEKPENT
jgi:hypothetical protein